MIDATFGAFHSRAHVTEIYPATNVEYVLERVTHVLCSLTPAMECNIRWSFALDDI